MHYECQLFVIIVIMQRMAGELNQECINFALFQTQQEEGLVRLKLFKPRLSQRALSLSDLIELKQKCPLLRGFTILDSTFDQEQAVVLRFESVEDAMDFQEEQRDSLTFSMALFQSSDSEELEKKASLSHQSEKLYKQIDDSGFCVHNGYITLKKDTSVQQIIMENCNEDQEEEQSTLVNTERKLSINEELQRCQAPQKQEKNKTHEKLQYFRTFVDGILVTGALYGGLKLLRFFMKC